MAIVGPTGAGKSALALHVARKFRGEIVNCDSLQVYRYFDIGTAKTPLSERGDIPHHLFDILDPDELFTAGDYSRLARQVLAEIRSRGRLPVIVGGTGFYLKALLDGLFAGPQRDTALRQRLQAREERRPGSLHRLLSRFDPTSAGRIHPHDRNKLIRALEICILARQPVTQLYQSGSQPLEGFRSLLLGLDPDRQQLYSLLNHRCKQMMETGLLDEVREILARGYPRSCKPFEAIGYKHALWVLDQKYPLDVAVSEMQKETRNYAKRQWTWFKKDTRVRWIAGFGSARQVQEITSETILKFLSADPIFLS
ncbi:MAG: tRNA (adenosine(37)-N6)-dimethylallyltransferase MiaA [Bryobacteraceae bacterium]|nr:tRNA (adenosine(37)-N6)-dimethylallyltransferase MiaA [Bryobacteraceae bacterium]MDW8380074.1 tRNA (adenosine(37)-N6)-dimethylallyltransferase MiaA [Bryobacterales bacterium]